MRGLTICLFMLLFVAKVSFAQGDSLLLELKKENAASSIIDEMQVYFNATYYQDPAKSLELALATDSLSQIHKFDSKYGVTNLLLGIAYNVNELYDKAIEAFLKSVDYSERLLTPKTQAQAFNGLAVVCQVRNDTETSALYFEKALEIYKSLNDTLWTGLINLNLGGLYMEDELLDKADHYLVDAIIAMDGMNQPLYAGYGKLNLGSLRVKQKRYEEAIPSLTEALAVVPYQVNPLIHAVGNSALGEAFLRKKEWKSSKKYLDLALEQSNQIKNFEQLEVVTGLLAEYHETNGNEKEALTYFKRSASLKDSFISKEEDERLIDALKKYEAEKKEQEIMLLSAENEFKDLRNERDRRSLIFALFSILGLGLILSIIVINRNKIKTLNKVLAEQKSLIEKNLSEKELLLKEIHHRVKNNLQVISSLLSLQSNYVKDPSALQALNLGKNRVKSMSLIHQNLYQEGNLTGVKLKPYFEKLCNNLFDSYSVNPDQVKLILQIENLDLEIDQVIPLGLIANELISNALKHAFNIQKSGELLVSLKQEHNGLHFKVEDNGIGIAPEVLQGKTDSFGYQMINAFKEKLDAELYFRNEGGLKVEMVI